jgi:1,4-dihydroxy-2-naphthoate octaprenyltransferase
VAAESSPPALIRVGSALRLFVRSTRAAVLPVMAAPVLIGAVLAWQQRGVFSAGFLLLSLAGALAAHLGANVLNDVFDYRSGADAAAARMLVAHGAAMPTGSPSLLAGRLGLSGHVRLAVSLFAVALACGLALTPWRPWALVFGAAGFLLALVYVAPPLRLAYVGRGAGELDILVSFGVLPLVGSFYVQTGTVAWPAVAVSIPVGLYTTAVLYFHHFLHWRADREVGKMSPVAWLGEIRGRQVGWGLLALIAVAVVTVCAVGVLPWYAVVALGTLALPALALYRADGSLAGYGRLMAATVNGDLLAALIVLAAILVRAVSGAT